MEKGRRQQRRLNVYTYRRMVERTGKLGGHVWRRTGNSGGNSAERKNKKNRGDRRDRGPRNSESDSRRRVTDPLKQSAYSHHSAKMRTRDDERRATTSSLVLFCIVASRRTRAHARERVRTLGRSRCGDRFFTPMSHPSHLVQRRNQTRTPVHATVRYGRKCANAHRFTILSFDREFSSRSDVQSREEREK